MNKRLIKSKIRKICKKTTTFALALLTVVGTAGTAVSPVTTTVVNAESGSWAAVETGGLGPMNMTMKNNGITTNFHGQMAAFTAGGDMALCVQPEVQFVAGTFTSRTSISGDLAAYAYYAHAMPEGNGLSRKDYQAGAQLLVWRKVDSTIVYNELPPNAEAAATAITNEYNKQKGTNNYSGFRYTGTGGQDLITGVSMTPSTISVSVSGKVKKVSGNTAITNNNSNYSLEGAKFKVEVTGPGKWSGTITTNANGDASFSHKFNKMPAGTKASDFKIKITETGAPKGYELNENSREIKSGGTANFSDPPKTANIPISINVNKRSSCPTVSNDNPNYSLADAEYRVDVTGKETWSETIKTDANGNASFSHEFQGQPLGTTAKDFNITVTETKAPKGYLLDGTPQTVESGGTVYFKDKPIHDPAGVSITKVSDDGVKNPKSLAGAEFTLKYYAVDPNAVNSVSDLNGKSYEKWTAETRKIGKSYSFIFADVKGDSHKDENGNNAIPVGVVTIQETKAPKGYTLKNKVVTVSGENVQADSNGIVLLKIVPDTNATSGARINFGNEYTVSDGSVRQGFTLIKYDSELGTNKTQGDATSLKAKFIVINNNDYDVESIDGNGTKRTAGPGETVYEFSTNDDGSFTTNNTLLPSGNYTVKETEGPVGYTLNGKTEATLTVSDDLTKNGQMIDLTGTIADLTIRGGFTLQKHDAETTKTESQGNAKIGPADYEVINESTNSVRVNGKDYKKGEVVFTFKTNDAGFYQSANDLLPYGTYRIKETSAPKGYNLDSTAKEGVVIQIRGDHVIISTNVSNTENRGGFTLQKHDSVTNKTTPEGDAVIGPAKYTVTNTSAHLVLVDKNKDGKRDVNTEYFAPNTVVYEFQTNEKGYFESPKDLLPYGTYLITEVEAPTGYRLDSTAAKGVTITIGKQDDMPAAHVSNTPKYGGFTLQKHDAETNPTEPQGDAKLGSAEYDVINESANPIVVNDGKNVEFGVGKVVWHFKTDENGAYASPTELLPYGTYRIKETSAPKGYNLDSTAKKGVVIQIRGDHVIISTDVSNTVERGNFKFAKRDFTDKSKDPEGNASLIGGTYDVINKSDHPVLVDKNGDGKKDLTTELFKPGDVVYEFTTTDKNTKDSVFTAPEKLLPFGRYTIQEVNAPEGYQLLKDNDATLSVDFTITEEGQTVDLTGNDKINNTAKRGTFSVKKNDLYLGKNIVQGDNNLSGKYALINVSKHPVYVDTNKNGKIDLDTEKFNPGEVIRNRALDDSTKKEQYSFTTAADGTFSWPEPKNGDKIYWQGLPYGSYQIKEVEPPKNYTKTGNTLIAFDITEDGQKIDRTQDLEINPSTYESERANKETFANEPVYGRVEIYKHVNKESGSEDDDIYENNARFLVILTSKLNSLYGGNMQAAWDALKDQNGKNIVGADGKNVVLSSHEFSIITTGTEKNADGKTKNGYGLSGKLATGKYSIMQFESGDAKGYNPEDLKMKDEVKNITITSNETTQVNGYKEWNDWKDIEDGNRLSVTNDELVYNLRIIKEDAATGKTVTFNSASFMVYLDADGDGKLTDADLKYNSVKSNGDIDYKYYQKDTGVTKIVNGVVTMTGSDGTEYNVFRTLSDNVGNIPKGTFVVSEVNSKAIDKGSAVQPLTLKKGTYFIVEKDNVGQSHATPKGYTAELTSINGDIEGNEGTVVGKTADGTTYLKFDINGTQYNVNHKSGRNAKKIESSTAENKDQNIVTKVFSWFNNLTTWISGTKRMELDDDYFVTQKVANKRVWGKLVVNKKIEPEPKDTDYTFIDRKEDIKKIQFTLYAAEDIIDPADGSVIVKKGDVAKIYDPSTRDYTINGVFSPNEDGKITVENIPLGKYTLKETYVPDGIVLLNDKQWNMEFKQPDNDRKTEVFNAEFSIENYTTKVRLSKKKITGEDELPGATLTILDENGKQVMKKDGTPLTWVSTEKPYNIEGLAIGKYQLSETIAAPGYVRKTTTIPFEIKNDKSVQKVTMKDKTLTLKKVDMNEKPVDGAELTVFELDENNNHVQTLNENGEKVDKVIDVIKYTSESKEGFKVNNLETGKKYEVVETITPRGFTTMKPYQFKVLDDDMDQLETVKNKRVEISKEDVGGKEVPGAILTITDKDGNVVDQWTSSDKTHYADNLKVGETYTLHEDTAPAGYVKATDITFTVKDDGIDQKVTMIDKTLTVKKIDMKEKPVDGAELTIYQSDGDKHVQKADENGNLVDKIIDVLTFTSENEDGIKANNLEAGKTYEIVETKTPKGFTTMKPYKFTVKDDGKDQTEIVKNKKVEISKEDVGGKELPGAILTITDKDGNVVDQWTSTEETHYADNLKVGETYTLHEDTAPAGYVKATDITFTVKDDGIDQKVTMIDKTLTVKKIDNCDKVVAGTELTVYQLDGDKYVQENDENGNLVDKIIDVLTFTSDSVDGIKVNNLEAGKTYEIVETKTPSGFTTMKPYKFTVKDDNKDQLETAKNKKVEISKEDVGGKEIPGAILTITDKDGNVVDQWTSSDEVHYADNLKVGETYTLHEDTAPLGYVKSTDVEFTVTDDGIDQKVTMIDEVERFSKTDTNGNLVKGATLEARDSNGKVIDTWVSGQHIVDINDENKEKLMNGETVIVTTEEGKKIEIIPLPEEVTEKNVKSGSEKLTEEQIKNACELETEKTAERKDGEVIKTEKVENPSHYVAVVTSEENTISYYDIGLDGDETTHMIAGLTEGEKYTVVETKAPETYIRSNEVVKVEPSTEGEDGNYSMVNTQYIFEKMTPQRHRVKGATITIYPLDDNGNLMNSDQYTAFLKTKENDAENRSDNVLTAETINSEEGSNKNKYLTDKDGYVYIDQWQTDGKTNHVIGGLDLGRKYLARETVTPNGFVQAADVYITVGKTEVKDHTVYMIDKMAIIQKLDEKNYRVKGAELTIYENDKEIDRWTTDGIHDHVIRNLIVGHTYTIKETKVPDGYEKAKDITFKLNSDPTNQTFRMVDNHKPEDANTGLGIDSRILVGSAAIAGGAILIVIAVVAKKKKRSKKDSKSNDDAE